MASFLDPDTRESILLVGGNEITALKSSEYVHPNKPGISIVTKGSSLGLKDIHVSTLRDDLRIWYTTKAAGVQYYTTKMNALSNGRLVPLLPHGQGGQISGLLSLRSTNGQQGLPVSTLVSVNKDASLLLLQQDPRSGVWQQFPFYHASKTNVMEVKGYTLRMQAKASSNSGNNGPGPDQALIPGCWLRVSSSGVIQCIINGRTASLTTTGQWFATNAQGILNILFATKDASCYKVLAEAFRPANTSEDSSAFRLLDAPILDPSLKVVSKLECIKSPQDLRTAKTQTGEMLISTNTSDDDVKKGAAAIKLLRDQIQNLEKRDNESLKVFRSTLAHQGQKSVYPVPFFWDEVLHGLGDAFNWLWEKAEEAWDWIVDKAGEINPRFARLSSN